MGCDIHLVVQRKVNNTWEDVTNRSPTPMVNGWKQEIDDRSYNLFSILANVRNGTWSKEIPYISEPRGIPSDFDKASYESEFDPDYPDDYKWLGDHSYSYVTLSELESYNWNHEVNMNASVDKEFLKTWDGKTPPSSYSAWSSNGVRITWKQTVRSLVEYWYDTYMPWLQSLGNSKDVRLVFGFDS